MRKEKINIIAEIGINHNGSLKLAKKLVDCAKNSGADYVKIQNYVPNLIVTKTTPKANYQSDKNKKKEKMFEMLKKYHFNFSKTSQLIKYCKKKNIKFLSSPFDDISFDFLKKKKLNIIKIASGEITNFPLLKSIAQYNKKILLSTGMSNLLEIEKTINFLNKSGLQKKNITILHCTSQYPTKAKDVNLNAMVTLKDKFNLDIGLSDHTLGFEASICAVHQGAKFIEKHLTLDKKMKGPDHQASLEPEEFKNFVKSLRNTPYLASSYQKNQQNKNLYWLS